MTTKALSPRLLLAVLLLGAQTLIAWHAPAHALNTGGFQGHLAAQHHCDLCLQGHGLVAVTNTLPAPPPQRAATPDAPPTTVAALDTPAPPHPARGPPTPIG